MSLIAGPLNNQYLVNLTHEHTPNCSEVAAAVAYAGADNLILFEACKTYGRNLKFYGRYDLSVPVKPAVIEWFLAERNPNFECRMVPDILHAKVIWWKDVGAYIGSANLTDRAWNTNIEAGTYMSQVELEDSDMIDELQNFFAANESRSQPITREFVNHLRDLERRRAEIELAESNFRKKVTPFFPSVPGLLDVGSNASATSIKYAAFEKAWRESLEALRAISELVSHDDFRPAWIPRDTPPGAQADQFIHAYYYRFIKGHQGGELVDNAYAKNRVRREQALKEALIWWREAEFDYSEERKHLLDWALFLRDALSRERLRSITKDEFVEALSKVHAIRAYGGKRRNSDLGIWTESARLEDKLIPHLTQVWEARSADGKSAIDLLDYVIWGHGAIEKRIWDGATTAKWRVQNLGFSALGEIVGWTRPGDYPPRNDRSIKGLRALGMDVRGV